MLLIKTLFVFVLVTLSGCGSRSMPNSYEPGCSRADAYCMLEIINHAIEGSAASNKYSDMVSERKKPCDAQVESLTKHINAAINK